MEYLLTFDDGSSGYLSHSVLAPEEVARRKYAFPEERKFPLMDRAHVLSAIKFFNYVDPEDEERLAKAILKRMRELGIEEVNVGKSNRFGKYYENGYLQHFGVKGMHWGVWNEETRARYLGGKGRQGTSAVEGSSKTGLSDKQKTALKVAAGIAAVAIVGGAGYYAYKKGYLHIGKNATKKALSRVGDKAVDELPEAAKAFKESLPKCPPNMTVDEHLKSINPLHGSWGHGDNCTSCTTAFEMRMRGYDVEAVPMENGQTAASVANCFKNAEIHGGIFSALGQQKANKILLEPDNDKRTEMLGEEFIKNPVTLAKYLVSTKRERTKTYKDLMKMEEGSRGNICVNLDGGGGHSIIWQKLGGELVLRDGQTGETYKNAKYLLSHSSNHQWFRTDNLDVDWERMSTTVRAHNPYYDTLKGGQPYSVNRIGSGYHPDIRERLRKASDL